MFTTLGRIAPPDTLWVTEAGAHEVPMSEYIHPGAPFSHMSAAGGGLGFGLPASIGAQLAAPDRPVVAVMGDGSMHYAISALWTAARYEIPVTVVVVSNAEYGVLKVFADFEKTPGVPGLDLPGLDITATAASYGVRSREARSSDELADMVQAGIADRDHPSLINVTTSRVDHASA